MDDGGVGDIFETYEMVFCETIRLKPIFSAVTIDDDFSETFVPVSVQRSPRLLIIQGSSLSN